MSTIVAQHVASVDGTRIAYWAAGDGPPLVLVHGSMADHTTMARLTPLLEPHFTVHAVDRRGRGASGDGREYTIEHEFADIAAVVDAIAGQFGTAVSLYGHSYGATCALGAAVRTDNVRRLVLYEPAVAEAYSYRTGLLDHLDALIEQSRADDAVELAFRELVGVSAAEVEALRAQPSWTARVAAAVTIPRELRIGRKRAFDLASFADLRTPTILLVGDRSPPGPRAIAAVVDEALPHSRTVALPGQEHMAQLTAPQLVARELIQFAYDYATGPFR